MTENLFSPEQFASMVKTWCVENRNSGGYWQKGDALTMAAVLNLGNVSRLTNLGDSKTGEEFTRIVLAPLSNQAVREDKLPPAYKKDVGVCIAYRGNNVDSAGRDGVMRAIVVMSPDDAQKFTDAVQVSPELVYALLRHVNGGPIVRHDGTPLDVKPGKEVEILPNDKIGGSTKTKTLSRPFNPGFKPNPLF